MKNYRQPGDCITITAPAAIKSGEVVIVGGLTGVATGDAAQGEATVIRRSGVFRLPLAVGVTLDEGDSAYYLAADKTITDVDGGGVNILIGYAVYQGEAPEGRADILIL